MKCFFASTLFLLAATFLSAQQVNVSTSGITSTTGVPPIYNGQYVIQKTDFGFLWLDTVALRGGLVQVESKCGVGQPGSMTNLYVLGDCNGISSVSSSGSIVLARQFSGQCGAASDGCGGPRDADGGTGFFAFGLGTWIFQGRTNVDIPDSSQASDLQGRTWKVQQNGLKSFTWIASGTGALLAPTPTPTPVITPIFVTTTPPALGTPTPLPKTDPSCPAAYPYLGPFGRCYDALGHPQSLATTPTPTPTRATGTATPTPTAPPVTPAIGCPITYPIPGAYGRCYDVAGTPQPQGTPQPKTTPTPTPTPTTPSVTPTCGCPVAYPILGPWRLCYDALGHPQPPTPTPTPTPVPKPC